MQTRGGYDPPLMRIARPFTSTAHMCASVARGREGGGMTAFGVAEGDGAAE